MEMRATMMTRVAPLSLADEYEARCAHGFESRKIRVIRIAVIRGDRHMIVDVPSSIARIQFRSLE
jgi:hypothetical protein